MTTPTEQNILKEKKRKLTKRQKAISKFNQLLKKYKRNPEWIDADVYLFTEQEVVFIYEELTK